jgi:tetratricopeptide (TPR) repeat protein
MNITKGSGSVRDSLVGLIVPGLLMTTLVGVLVVKWRPALATESAPLPPGTLSALHRAAVKETAAEGESHEAFLRVALKGRVGDPGGLSTARDDLSRAVSGLEQRLGEHPSDTAAAYARVSYAKELQGDLNGALHLMRRATDAISAHDPEGQAWHQVQVGDLLFAQGKISAARREYDHAAFIFPDHPMAAAGLARVMAVEQNFAGALAIYEDLMAKGQLPHLAARAGDMHARLGHETDAAKMYALAENGWRFDTPEPAALVGFLATHDRAILDAVSLGERAAATRQDVMTMDALAWAYFRAGRMDDALKASKQALRTGTRERSILYHAAAIHRAAGDMASARMLIAQAVDGHPEFDPIEGPAARALAKALLTVSPKSTLSTK